MLIVGVSSWLSHCAKESRLFADARVETLPNPLDTDIYFPVDRNTARNLFCLPLDRRLVLFGALNSTSDINKGFRELCLALDLLKTDADLVIFGASSPKNPLPLSQKIHYVGVLYDDQSLALLYSACDVMVVPSRQESFGQTASESMACGTPVVAFAKTGLLDLVDHKVNGYLAEPFSSEDLALGIDWVLTHKQYSEVSRSAREKSVKCFNSGVVTEKYLALYHDVIHR